MKKFFQWIKRLFSSAVVGAEMLNTTITVQQTDPVPLQDSKEVKQLPWFQKQNNLCQEFVGEKVMVYGSNFSHAEPIGYYDGYGDYVSMSDKKIEKEELLKDDISLLKNVSKPNLEQENIATYKSGL